MHFDTIAKMAKPAARSLLSSLLGRGVVSCIGQDHLEHRLQSGKRLRVKHGIDPTTAELHLGYLAVYRKLRMLQELGHTIVIVLGEFTARFGDPTGGAELRPLREAREVKALRKPYLAQLARVLDLSRTEIRSNAEWYDAMRADEFLRLLNKVTAAQMLERDMFKHRQSAGKEVALHELTYPVLQGYDSVMVRSDLTVIGSDQTFNEMVGRHLQEAFKQNPQDILALDMLVGLDGHRKMSQSFKNTIGIQEPPEEQYGKIMSLPDSALFQYFTLLTDVPEKTLKRWGREAGSKKRNPKELKERLARTIVSQLWGEKRAGAAAQEFARVFERREAPANLKTSFFVKGHYRVTELLVHTRLVPSHSEARRLIVQRGVRIDGTTVADPSMRLTISPQSRAMLLQVGSRRFIRIAAKKTP